MLKTYFDRITGITQANPAVVTAIGHGFGDGVEIKIFDAGGMTEVHGVTFTTANVTANTYEL